MTKFKIKYSGFAYVEADTEEEALEMYDDDDTYYSEQEVDWVEEVDSFEETI